MVIANVGDCFSWVKKENKQKWEDRMKGIQGAKNGKQEQAGGWF
jgi:hypothetical protein